MGYRGYLRQRGGVCHFRRVIPKDLVVRFGRREILRSIGVLPASERQSAVRRFCLACDELFRMVRLEPMLTREEIDRLVAVYLDELATRDEEYASWLPRRPLADADFHRRAQITAYSDLARSAADARRTRTRVIDEDMLEIVARNAGMTFDFDGPDALRVEDALTEALAHFYDQRAEALRCEGRIGKSSALGQFIRDLLEVAVSRAPVHEHATGHVRRSDPANQASPRTGGGADGRSIEDRLQSTDQGPGSDPANEAPNILEDGKASAEQITEDRDKSSFGALWASFVHSKVTLRREWKPSRMPELLGTSRLWVWIVGDLPVGAYTSQHIRKFHDTFLTLPADYMRLRHTKKGMLSPTEVVAKAASAAEKAAKGEGSKRAAFQRVDPKTFNKHLANLKAFFAWKPVADAREKGAPDPTHGFHIKIEKSTNKVRSERNMAPVKAIAELFDSPYWTGRASEYFMVRPGHTIVRDALYWIPLMIALHGLRREEAAQLRVHHVKSMIVTSNSSTIWYFDLTAKDLVLKEPTKGSPRCVPFHQKFQQLGFLEDKVFGRKPNEHLFPELSNENAHSAFGVSIGKRFGNYVNSLKFSEASYRDDLSLQAMRHTVRTLLDNTKAKEAYVDELVGHESEEGGPKRDAIVRRFTCKISRKLLTCLNFLLTRIVSAFWHWKWLRSDESHDYRLLDTMTDFSPGGSHHKQVGLVDSLLPP